MVKALENIHILNTGQTISTGITCVALYRYHMCCSVQVSHGLLCKGITRVALYGYHMCCSVQVSHGLLCTGITWVALYRYHMCCSVQVSEMSVFSITAMTIFQIKNK